MDSKYINIMNNAIRRMVRDGLVASLTRPASAFALLKMMKNQKIATDVRKAQLKNGFHIPPFLIVSITRKCNLQCKGCYSNHFAQMDKDSELSTENWIRVLSDADRLGVSFVLVAGGEPFSRKDIIDITSRFPNIVFPVFTNGTLINSDTVAELKRHRNIIPVFSLEGSADMTDSRRGEGIARILGEKLSLVKKASLFSGISFTVTSENIDIVTDPSFIKELSLKGASLFFFVEYVPVTDNSEHLVLSDEQRKSLAVRIDKIRSSQKGVFVSFPGDEEAMGGCIAGGRGFIHINASGKVEPCPFAPYSDSDLKEMDLLEALSSPLLKKIREGEASLKSVSGGCALWSNREAVKKIIESE